MKLNKETKKQLENTFTNDITSDDRERGGAYETSIKPIEKGLIYIVKKMCNNALKNRQDIHDMLALEESLKVNIKSLIENRITGAGRDVEDERKLFKKSEKLGKFKYKVDCKLVSKRTKYEKEKAIAKNKGFNDMFDAALNNLDFDKIKPHSALDVCPFTDEVFTKDK